MVDSKARRSFIGLLKGIRDLMKADTLYTYRDGESLHKDIMEGSYAILNECFIWADKYAHPSTGSRRFILAEIVKMQGAILKAQRILGDLEV